VKEVRSQKGTSKTYIYMEFKLKIYGVNNDPKFVTHNYDIKLSFNEDLAVTVTVAAKHFEPSHHP
jgi:hypothetical protein